MTGFDSRQIPLGASFSLKSFVKPGLKTCHVDYLLVNESGARGKGGRGVVCMACFRAGKTGSNIVISETRLDRDGHPKIK